MSPASKLARWTAQYHVPGLVEFSGWAELGGSEEAGWTMGRCDSLAWSDGTCESRITLDVGMRDAPGFIVRSVLWHEFCHANAFNEDGTGNGHDAHFRRYVRRRPLYWLGDEVAERLAARWVRRRRPSPISRRGPC